MPEHCQCSALFPTRLRDIKSYDLGQYELLNGDEMTTLILNFLRDEDGAVTVDWVVLTAAIVAINVGLVMSMLEDGMEQNSTYVRDQAANAVQQGG